MLHTRSNVIDGVMSFHLRESSSVGSLLLNGGHLHDDLATKSLATLKRGNLLDCLAQSDDRLHPHPKAALRMGWIIHNFWHVRAE